MKILSSREAARELGISVQRVRVLARVGKLPANKVGNRWIVEQLPRERRTPRNGRPLSSRSAWAFLALISGHTPSWMPASSVSRLRRRMRNCEWALGALEGSQARAKTEYFRFLPVDLPRIRAEHGVVLSGLSALTSDFDLFGAADHLDAYLGARRLESLKRVYRPAAAVADANVTLRVPTQPWILSFSRAPAAVVAADLLHDPDARIRRAGREVLRRILDG